MEARLEVTLKGIRDEMVNINFVCYSFTDDAWKAVLMVTSIKKG